MPLDNKCRSRWPVRVFIRLISSSLKMTRLQHCDGKIIIMMWGHGNIADVGSSPTSVVSQPWHWMSGRRLALNRCCDVVGAEVATLLLPIILCSFLRRNLLFLFYSTNLLL
ncbi:hypothetical protein TNCV_4465711 [Trichonephila clavipes]|nr:hypothetical protein TNCV_4465711 [Trichonephila clavipes]